MISVLCFQVHTADESSRQRKFSNENGEKMKVLVTGASGLLGRAVAKVLREEGHTVVGTALSRVKEGMVKLDLEDAKDIAGVVASEKAPVIVHCAAERRPDECEGDPARTNRINAVAVQSLGEAAKKAGSWVIYISTDYVFDGTCPPYAPGAAKNPPNVYGHSKSKGEDAILKSTGGDCCILRVPVLYGPVEKIGESSVTVLTKMVFPRVKEGQEVDNWQIRYPTHTHDVARAIGALIGERGKRGGALKGTFHFSGSESWTKYEMVSMISDILEIEIPAGFVTPNSNPPPAGSAPRPKDTCLDCSSLRELLGESYPSLTPLRDGLQAVLTALIPSAALKKKGVGAGQVRAAGFKPAGEGDVNHDVLKGPDDELVEILGGSGQVIKTKRKVAKLVMEANKFAAEGNLEKAVERMNLAVKEDPSLENMDTNADKRLMAVMQQLVANGEKEKAKALLDQYYKKKLLSFKDGSWETITVVEAHVMLFKSLQEWENMAKWTEKSVEMVMKHRGAKTTEYAQALSNHGLAIAPLDRHEEAEKCFKEALGTQETIKGKDSQEVAQICHNLALLYRNTGRYSEAAPLYDRALATWSRLNLWLNIIVTSKDAAMNHKSGGEVEGARRAMETCLAELRKAPGDMQQRVTEQLKINEFMAEIGMEGGNAASGKDSAGDKKGD